MNNDSKRSSECNSITQPKSDGTKISRRSWLAGTAVTLAASSAKAANKNANEKIHIGMIGCGSRNLSLLRELSTLKSDYNFTVSAVCDVWKTAREKKIAAVKSAFPSGSIKQYSRYQDLLREGKVDAVIITTPDSSHSPILAEASKLKIDAYCEKPMATNIHDANLALDEVRKNKTIVQIGTQRRSFPQFADAAKMIQAGGVGKVVAIDTAWHDHNPRWLDRSFACKAKDVDWQAFLLGKNLDQKFDARRLLSWQLYHDYTVGLPGLLGSHFIDLATWFTGQTYPASVTCHGSNVMWKEREHVDTIECVWKYKNDMLLRYASRLGNSCRVPEVTVYGSRGTFDTKSWEASPNGGGKHRLKKSSIIKPRKRGSHMENWLQCLVSRKDPNATIEHGHYHSVASIMAFQSLLEQKMLFWDEKRRKIVATKPS